MIKFTEGGIADLWPDQTSPEFKALSYALKRAICMVVEKADQTKCFADVDKLPEDILDYFAVEMRTMYYRQDMPIEQKRIIIKKTMEWYSKAGTPYAVAELSEIVFGVGKVVEWPDYDEPPYTRGTFDIVTSAIMTPDIITTLTGLLMRVKNTRSHIRRVVIERELHSATSAAITQVATQEAAALNILNGDIDLRNGWKFGAALYAIQETFVLNHLKEQDAETENGLRFAGVPITTSVIPVQAYDSFAEDAELKSKEYVAGQGVTRERSTAVLNDTSGETEAKQTANEAQAGITTVVNTFIKEEH